MVKQHASPDYEMSREQRIKENRERMQKLGIFDLSIQMVKRTPKTNLNRKNNSPLPPRSGPLRRSSRLQNSTPISYSEVRVQKKDQSLKEVNLPREGSKPEVYTKEHEKLLGSTEKEWTLFVDGYGKDGKRIYDPIKGKTCHQCRQKTLGHHTHCCKCNIVQGQFCGDCLYMRYGENVLEANANPDWTCPVCRGICNCSICRQAKGWAPTGLLYRKISSLGYKSVAHYLVQTRLESTDSDVGTNVPVFAKRSLPFSDSDDVAISGEVDVIKFNCDTDPTSCVGTSCNHLVKEEKLSYEKGGNCEKMETESGVTTHDVTTVRLMKGEFEQLLKPETEENGSVYGDKKKQDNFTVEVTIEQVHGEGLSTCEEATTDFVVASNESAKSSTKNKKKRCISEPSPDTIAGRLRLTHSN